jgi:hypothetical protein
VQGRARILKPADIVTDDAHLTAALNDCRTPEKQNLAKTETVMITAIILGLESTKYCAFLAKHGVKPKWSDSGPSSYSKAYKDGDPWRKKIQDQKTRVKQRLNSYSRPELATAINTHLPNEFDQIGPLINSHNSQNASKTPD